MRYTAYYVDIGKMSTQEFLDKHLKGSVTVLAKNYNKMGEIEGENVEEIFRKAQNLSETEVANFQVGDMRVNARSMMVGDVLIDENNKGFICRAIGWQEFNPEEAGFTLSGKE